jgi:hypothetical protein
VVLDGEAMCFTGDMQAFEKLRRVRALASARNPRMIRLGRVELLAVCRL